MREGTREMRANPIKHFALVPAWTNLHEGNLAGIMAMVNAASGEEMSER